MVISSQPIPRGEYMRHALHRRGGLIAGLVAVALVTLFALPAVSSAATRTDKAQNKRIAKQAKSIKKLGKGLKLVTTNLGKIDTRLKTIENAAPAIVSGLNQLKDGLTKLQTLGLSHTKVTDEGTVSLKKLRELRELYLNGTRVTLDGINELRRGLPEVKVSR